MNGQKEHGERREEVARAARPAERHDLRGAEFFRLLLGLPDDDGRKLARRFGDHRRGEKQLLAAGPRVDEPRDRFRRSAPRQDQRHEQGGRRDRRERRRREAIRDQPEQPRREEQREIECGADQQRDMKPPAERGDKLPRGGLPHQSLGVVHGLAMPGK